MPGCAATGLRPYRTGDGGSGQLEAALTPQATDVKTGNRPYGQATQNHSNAIHGRALVIDLWLPVRVATCGCVLAWQEFLFERPPVAFPSQHLA
jgi:hypothetical protein